MGRLCPHNRSEINWIGRLGIPLCVRARDKNERMNEHNVNERVCMWIWIGIRCPVSPLYKYFLLLTHHCEPPPTPSPHRGLSLPSILLFARWFDCRWWCFSLQMLSSFISRISRCHPSQILHLSSARTNILNGGSKGLKLFLYCVRMLFAYMCATRTSVKKYILKRRTVGSLCMLCVRSEMVTWNIQRVHTVYACNTHLHVLNDVHTYTTHAFFSLSFCSFFV